MASFPETVILQAGAIPFRRTEDGHIEVMLITSSSARKWIIPKGNREPLMPLHECAAMEAFEEAGVMGPVSPRSIGSWRYDKRGMVRQVEVFPLEARQVLSLWPERGYRRRRWMPTAEAADRIAYPDLAEFIHGLQDFLAVHEMPEPLAAAVYR